MILFLETGGLQVVYGVASDPQVEPYTKGKKGNLVRNYTTLTNLLV